MARPLRIEFPNAVYHITSRGNAKQTIFLDDKDKANFLNVLSSVVKRFKWICHAYCLMDNHYHLLIETPEGNISEGMRQLNGVYTQKFNRRHNIVGHLFQGRYKSILVDKDSYLLTLCRYIVLNPVRANLTELPQKWQWSSYRATMGEIETPNFLTTDWILSQIGGDIETARKQYKQFVMEGINAKFPKDKLKGQILIGNKNFMNKINNMLKDKKNVKEIPKSQRYATSLKLNEIFSYNISENKMAISCKAGGKESRAKDKGLRNQAIYRAYMHCGYSFKEIAQYLNLHYTTISKIVNEIEKKNGKT